MPSLLPYGFAVSNGAIGLLARVASLGGQLVKFIVDLLVVLAAPLIFGQFQIEFAAPKLVWRAILEWFAMLAELLLPLQRQAFWPLLIPIP